MDGRGIAAAQALGAQAVQMGTAFLACPESGITPAQRAAMARAQGTDTRITRAYSGRPARGIVNTMMERLAADEAAIPPYPIQNALTGALRRAAGVQGRADYLSLWAGQGVGAARVMPAGELVALLAQEWRAATARARE
jgi:nitronate monooxygenase